MFPRSSCKVEMKNRPPRIGDGDEAMAPTGGKGNYKRKMKNRRRLGGNGLSLQAFANSKSNNAYNPHLIKKQREMYKNAKIVKKFKKILKHDNEMKKTLPRSSMPEGIIADREGNQKNDGRKKKKGSLQSMREEYGKKREEMEKAKMEREAIVRAKEEEKARAASKRKTLRQSMFKKTRSGQPLMKYRITRILEGIKDDQHS